MEKSSKLLIDVQPGKEREGGGRKIESGRERDKDKGGKGGRGGRQERNAGTNKNCRRDGEKTGGGEFQAASGNSTTGSSDSV